MRRSRLLTLWVLLTAAAVLLGACSSSGTKTAPPATQAPASTGRPYAVGRLDITLVDHSRPTAASPAMNQPAKPDRTLPVMVLYPASGAPSGAGTPTTGAPAHTGRFPLVVFSHGVTASGPVYEPFLQTWARAGYVVAAPTYPLTSGPKGNAGLIDYKNQPADVSFVITSLLKRNDDPADPLHGRIDPAEIAAAGHSLGAITTLGVVYNSCCIDKRVKAAISFAGIELPFDHGSFDNPPPTPALLVQGAKDTTIPIAAGSDKLFTALKPPVYYLRFTDATHSGIFVGVYEPLSSEASIAFLDAELRGNPGPLAAMPEKVARSGLGTWRQRVP